MRLKILMVLSLGLVMLLGLGADVYAAPLATSPLMAVSPPMVVAQNVDSLRQQQQQIEQKRRTINQERNRLENLEESAEERLKGLETNIKATTSEIRANEAKLKAANENLKKLQVELANAEEEYQDQQFATVARLRYLQRQQESQGWAVLLQSRNLNEFLDRRYQLRLVYSADRQFLETLSAETKALDDRRRNVERQKNEIALLMEELQAQKAEYEQQAETQEELIGRLRSDRKALEAAEDQLARDSANIAGLIRQRLNALSRSRIVVRGTGIFSIPSDGRLTSSFGYRVHPILGYRRFHAGIDFGASYGSPIRAADRGVVIFSGWYGGYGRTVIIDHGNNITTMYAHTSQVYVQEGQTVERGQAIAAVGSTGLSTGPHLHFEVRRGGEPVNPLNFL